jgi:hypothetical protein
LTTITCRPGEQVRAAFLVGKKKHIYALTTNSVYFFYNLPDSAAFDLREIEMLNRPAAPAQPVEAPEPVAAVTDATAGDNPTAPPAVPASPQFAKVKVKILVDDDEHAVREIWEARLRKRIAAASKILESYAGITLEVVACDTWITDNKVNEFPQSLAEFERDVSAAPADVAIGFSSQFQLIKGRTHLGGTRGALASHILIREWSRQISEPERLEVLVHELGHRFGAVHSPEINSVMRPMLGDRKSVAKGFRILFDPLNTLAIRLLGEELRDRRIRRLEDVSPRTQQNLVAVYSTLAKAFPEDPAAGAYLVRLGEPPPAAARPAIRGRGPTLVEAARVVRDAVVEFGDRNRRLPEASTAAGREARLEGDDLTEHYVRAAATAALTLPEQFKVKAFGMGLGVALSDTDDWQTNNIAREMLPLVENANERARRRAVIGQPTMHGRHDLARHFFLSEAMAGISSAKVSESAGLVKELQDAQSGSGFSFADLTADMAGIALMTHLQAWPDQRLKEVAKNFTIRAYVPSIEGLPEGMKTADFRERYGSISDPRFTQELEKIRASVRDLPLYQAAAKAPTTKPPAPQPPTSEPSAEAALKESPKSSAPKASAPKSTAPKTPPPARVPNAAAPKQR